MHLVPPVPKPKPTKAEQVLARVAAAAPAHMLKCPRCSGMEFTETICGVEVTAKGKPRGGTKQLICFTCMSIRGERVVCR